MKPRRYCLTLDLKDDPELIAEYRRYHENIWPEIAQEHCRFRRGRHGNLSAGNADVHDHEVNEQFSFAAKGEADRSNPKVQEWEQLMWKFQKPLPQAKPGEKWLLIKHSHS